MFLLVLIYSIIGLLKFNVFIAIYRLTYSDSIIQVVTEYSEDQLELVLEACERMNAHLTAAVVSNDPLFLQESWFNSLQVGLTPHFSHGTSLIKLGFLQHTLRILGKHHCQ